jgi:hypothetical protein
VTPNPYAPPKAEVADVADIATSAPALWNPNAAANWSLLFSPAFGAFLHMKNWEALGQPGKAKVAKVWFVLSLVMLGGVVLVPVIAPQLLDGGARGIEVMWLFAWYFTGGRPQVSYVRTHFGKIYPRRGWWIPLISAVVAIIAFGLATGILATVVKITLRR